MTTTSPLIARIALAALVGVVMSWAASAFAQDAPDATVKRVAALSIAVAFSPSASASFALGSVGSAGGALGGAFFFAACALSPTSNTKSTVLMACAPPRRGRS